MHATIRWQTGASFLTQSGSGHQVTTDGAVEMGGKNKGARPMELLLMGLGACSAFDLTQVLQKTHQTVHDCWVDVQAQRAQSSPKVFTAIHLGFVVVGVDISESLVRRTIALSAQKYCSASIMLQRGGVNITHDYRIELPTE